jgi:hypothetical protein
LPGFLLQPTVLQAEAQFSGEGEVGLIFQEALTALAI